MAWIGASSKARVKKPSNVSMCQYDLEHEHFTPAQFSLVEPLKAWIGTDSKVWRCIFCAQIFCGTQLAGVTQSFGTMRMLP